MILCQVLGKQQQIRLSHYKIQSFEWDEHVNESMSYCEMTN